MADNVYSFVHYVGDGTTRIFSVPFDYLERDHVVVKVDGEDASFEWLDSNTIRLTEAPPSGVIIEVRRETSHESRRVIFHDGSVLTEDDLNDAVIHTFYMAQEAVDLARNTLLLTPTGEISARGRRLTDLADPVDPQDAVTKSYVDPIRLDALKARDEAVQAKDIAVSARDRAEAARDIAKGFASDIVSQGNVPIYASAATVQGLEIPAGITAFRTNGETTPGDGKGSLYVESDASSGTLQSGDGRWWVEAAVRDHGTFSTVADVQSRHIPAVLDSIELRSLGAPGELGNSIQLVRSSQTGSAIQSKDGQWWDAPSLNLMVTVGSAGDFPDINSAMQFLGRVMPGYRRNFSLQNPVAEIRLLSGFVMKEVVIVEGEDYGWIKITSEDSVVPIDRDSISFRNITEDLYYTSPRVDYPVFGAIRGGVLPTIGALFDMGALGDGGSTYHGVAVFEGSHVTILPGCGVINVPGRGLFAWLSSTATANRARFSGLRGVNAARNSRIDCNGVDVSDSIVSGIHCFGNSDIYARQLIINGGPNEAIHCVDQSRVEASIGNVKNVHHYIYTQNNSTVYVRNSNVTNITGRCIHAENQSKVVAHMLTVSGVGTSGAAFEARAGSEILLENAYISDTEGGGLLASRGGHIVAPGAELVNIGGMAAITALRGALISAESVKIDGAAQAFNATRSGEIVAPLATVKNVQEVCFAVNDGTVAAPGLTVENVTGRLVTARSGSTVNLANQGGTQTTVQNVATGGGNTILLEDGSRCIMPAIEILGAGTSANTDFIRVERGSELVATGASISGIGRDAVVVFEGSRACAIELTVTGHTRYGLRADAGEISCAGAVVDDSSSSDYAFFVQHGGIIRLHSGGTPAAVGTANVTRNVLSGDGVVFGPG